MRDVIKQKDKSAFMTNILIPVSIFVFSGALALIAAQFAVASFVIGALINIIVNRRKKSAVTNLDNDDRDVLLIRSSYALMAPAFILVAVILVGMLGATANRVS